LPSMPLLDAELVAVDRALPIEPDPALADALERLGLVREEHRINGPRGPLDLTVIRPRVRAEAAPGLFMIHGGGMVIRNRFAGLTELHLVELVAEFGLVLVTPEYGLAPDHPSPGGVEDCYAALLWTVANAEDLGIDPTRIVLGGASGGGGLAAGTALLVRERGGVELLAQLLLFPQLDDRNATVSARQFRQGPGIGFVWPTENNEFAWDALLGEGHGDREIEISAAPGRADDLSRLPPTFLDVGDAEVFRDEVVAYASLLWAGGVNAELHVWPGMYHGLELVSPMSPIAVEARAARAGWLRRVLNPGG
jgi:acetyl esterase/lipase